MMLPYPTPFHMRKNTSRKGQGAVFVYTLIIVPPKPLTTRLMRPLSKSSIVWMTAEATTQEMKYGRKMKDWKVFLNHRHFISLMMMANPTSITMPTTMNARLYSSVLRVSGQSLLDTTRKRKFFSPTHGLSNSPLE